jgi:hypothetical protein
VRIGQSASVAQVDCQCRWEVVPLVEDSPPSWDEVTAGLPRRLALPIYRFTYEVRYVPILLQQPERRVLGNIVRASVVEALRAQPECELSALEIEVNQSENIESTSEIEAAYVTVVFRNPVFHFAIQVGPSRFRITKERCTLADLLHTVRLFSVITSRLFADDGGTTASLTTIGLTEHVFRLNVAFEHHLVLGRLLSNETIEIRNLDLFKKLARVDMGNPPIASPEAPLAALQPDVIYRGDLTFGFRKKIRNRSREMWITYEGPWNVTQKDIDIRTSYRVGEGETSMERGDLYDFRTPFIDFFRDLVLKRFFADLFDNIEVTGRF